MIRLILLALFFFLGYTLVQALFRRPTRRPPDDRTRKGESMVQDPECGTYLPASDAIRAKIGGKNLYFCSKKCRDHFRKRN